MTREPAVTNPARELSFPHGGDSPVVPAPSFALGLWRIAAADVSSGNHVTLLRDGPATFDSMVELIESAQHSVLLESYIFRSDEVGERVAAALGRAAARGARVRVLVDWIGIRGTSRAFLQRLRASNIELAIFNPPVFRRWLGFVHRDQL